VPKPKTPDPRPRRPPEAATDIRQTAWYRFVEEIDALRRQPTFSWAQDTLAGIRAHVVETRRVTEGQRKAVANIEAAGERAEGWRRRGESFRGRWR